MNARKQNLQNWIAELELTIVAIKDCGEDASEYELSLATAREELAAF